MAVDYSRIHRLLKVVQLIQGQRGWTAGSLAQECGVSTRTIYRDMDMLAAAGIPSFYDEKSKCYQIRGDFFMQPVDLTLEESLALVALAEHVGGAEQIPFTKAAARAVSKVRSQLPEAIRRELQEVDEHMAIQLAPTSAGDAGDVYDKVRRAIADRHMLLCEYESVTQSPEGAAAPAKPFELKPYTLLFSQRAWYVVGHRSDRKAVRILKLSRFTRLDATDKPYEIPKNFSLKAHLGNAWRMIRGEKSYDIELRFDKTFADNIAEVQWHPTQKIEWNGDGSITFRCKVDGLDEIVWWVLGMGPSCVVKRPKELAGRVKKLAEEIAARYV